MIKNHYSSYQPQIIDMTSVQNAYKKYWYLLASILIFGALMLIMLFMNKPYLAFGMLMIEFLFITLIPSLLIFNSTLLSKSKFILLVISYIFAIIAFGCIYFLLQMYFDSTPTPAFQLSKAFSLESLLDFFYFSVVTITTLGSGDILPLNYLSKLLVSFEVLLGVMYAVVGLSLILVNKDTAEFIAIEMKKILEDR